MARTRSAAAKLWGIVLSELALVPISVEWEPPAWRVRWTDGPTQFQLAGRAHALSAYRIGSPLAAEQMRFSRTSSIEATALSWLVHGSEITPLEDQRGISGGYAIEQWCIDMPYPQEYCGTQLVAIAAALAQVARIDAGELARLIQQAHPPLLPAVPAGQMFFELPGRVLSYRWPGSGGPPAELLEPRAQPGPVGAPCEVCGRLLLRKAKGRTARFCSDRCRVAAHRHRLANSRAG